MIYNFAQNEIINNGMLLRELRKCPTGVEQDTTLAHRGRSPGSIPSPTIGT